MEQDKRNDEIVVFIINPNAGSHPKENILQAIRQYFDGDEYRLLLTERAGHAFELTRKMVSEGYRKIVAVGGDGTVNEVASALVGNDCTLGIIPVGSGNGLARHLRIPVHLNDALNVTRNHWIKVIDAGMVNERYFFCTCGTGFDAKVGKEFAQDSRRGMLSYVRATIHQYINYSPKSYELKISGKIITLEAFLVTFANAGQYGNNAYIAPNALIDDGLLDLCILRPFPKTSTISLGLRLFFKNIDQSPYLEVMRVKKATLRRSDKRKIRMHIDGEPLLMKGKIKIQTIPAAVQVMVPKTRRKRLPVIKLNK